MADPYYQGHGPRPIHIPLLIVGVSLTIGILFLNAERAPAEFEPATPVAATLAPARSFAVPPTVTGAPMAAARLPEENFRNVITRPQALPSPTQPPTTLPGGGPQTVQVPILMYHHIGPLAADADTITTDLTVDPAVFEAHLQAMAAAGYHTIRLYDLYNAITVGAALPDKPVVLTFDDGYRDAYEYGFPLLKKYGYIGTFFLVTGPMDAGHPGYMTWPQAEEMARAGMDLEPHTKSHLDLRHRSWDTLIWEIIGSAETVAAHTGRPSRFFAYPSGLYDDQVITLMQQAHFLAAAATIQGTIHSPDSLYTLSRVRIRRTDSADAVLVKLRWNF